MSRDKFTLTVIWEDADLIELRVEASNDSFCGATEEYFVRSDLIDLAKRVRTFPSSNTDGFTFQSSAGTPYSSVEFYCIDGAGHGALRVTVRRNCEADSREEERDEAHFEILLGGRKSLEEFAAELDDIAATSCGVASLFADSGADSGRRLWP